MDLFILLLLIFVILPHKKDEARASDEVPPGSVMVEISWPPERDADVDLWVRAPDDKPVGYSNLGGRFFNLLRDDLGHHADESPVNFEVSYSRGRPAGEYVATIHYYRDADNGGPVLVQWRAVVTFGRRNYTVVANGEALLERQGQETMLVRFTLDEHGKAIAFNRVPIMLRSRGQ